MTVTDNDLADLTLVVDPSTVLEGGTARVTVALVGEETFATDQTITLAFPTDSADSTRATKGNDYTVASETLTLAAGVRQVSTLVTTVDDAAEEALETITVTASHEGTRIGSTILSILGNDEATVTVPTIEIKAGPRPPEGSAAAFTLTRSGATTAALTVRVAVTAAPVELLSGTPPTTVRFESGQGSAVLEVATRDDAVVASPGAITARVLAATDDSYSVSDLRSEATLTVTDNDLPEWAVVLDTNPVPGLGNLMYPEAELWSPLSILKPRWTGHVPGYGRAFMADGYLSLIRAFDGNRDLSYRPPKWNGIDVWDISNPRLPSRVQSWDDGRLREAHGLGLWNRDGQIILVAQTHKGIAFYDVTSIGTRLRRLAELDLPGVNRGDYSGAWWLSVQAPYVYVAAVGGGLHVVDATDPTAPKHVKRLSTGDLGGISPASVSAVGNLLVLAETDVGHGYATLDLSDPVNPVLIETINGAAGYSHLFTAGRLFASGSRLDSHKMYVYEVEHDGRMRYAGEAGEGLGEGGYGSYQDGHFFGGFSKQVAKFSLDPPAQVGSGTSGLGGRDEDFAQPLGNLLVASDDSGRPPLGTALIPHQAAPDTSGPEVVWTHPADGATDLALTTRVGASLSDEVAIESLTPARFRVTRPDGSAVAGQLSANQTNVNFTPDAPLAASTTYTVEVCRLKDLAGNAGGCTEWTFRTRTETAAPPSCRLDRFEPIETDTATSYEPVATTNEPTSYTWDFGSGEPVGPQTTEAATFTYLEPGRYPVVLTVANAEGTSQCGAVQIVHTPVTETPPVSSSSIIITVTTVELFSNFFRDRTDIYVANPDNDTVTRLFWDNTKVWEVAVGTHPRTLAEAPDGTIWVANQGSGNISVLSRAGEVVRTIDLGYGTAPYGLVFAPDGAAAYVTLTGRGRLLKLNPTTGTIVATLDLGGRPRGIAVSGDSGRIFVTRFVSAFVESDAAGTDDAVGEVYEVDAATFTLTRTLPLAFDPGPDTEASGRGVPNYLSQVRIAPDGQSAWVPSKKDNIARGQSRDGLDLDFESQTRTIVSQLDLTTNAEVLAHRIDFNDRDLVQALVFTPVGDAFIVAFTGSNVIEVWDAAARTRLSEVPVGRAPTGLALRPDGRRLYVHNFLDRSVTVLNTAGLLDGTVNQPPVVTTISTVEVEALESAVLRGKRIFYNAADPRMNQDGYISCASCHLDGGADGMVWDRTQAGEGLRNTIDLRGRRGTNGGLVHWSGNFDEIQDFEHDSRTLFGGTGFMTDSDFQTGTRNQPLGDAKAGVSDELDDLAAYVESLDTYPPSPYRPGGSLTDTGRVGRVVFRAKKCAGCHTGPDLTDDQSHDVGTITTSSGQGGGTTLTGINTPTLRGLWLSAPYLHDGSAATLAAVLDNTTHMGAGLTAQEKVDLAAFLVQIEEDQPPVVTGLSSGRLEYPEQGSTALGTFSATDPEGDPVTWDVTGPDGTHFSLEGGVLRFRSPPDYEAPADKNGDNVYAVAVVATDGRSLVTVVLRVAVVGVDEPPVVVMEPSETELTYPEQGSAAVATFSATDPEGGPVTWDVTGPDRTHFRLEGGVLRFISPPDYEAPADEGGDNVYAVAVVATDGQSPVTVALRVAVTNEDEGGRVEWSSERPRFEVALQAILSDPDSPAGNFSGLTWAWARSMDRQTWETIRAAAADRYTPVPADRDYYLRVTVTYTDGHGAGKTAEAVSTESVLDPSVLNTAPVFAESRTTRVIAENTAAGQPLGGPVAATDPDITDAFLNDRLTYRLSGPAAAAFALDAASGQLQTQAPLNYEQRSSYQGTVTVTDSFGQSATIPVTIEILDVNEPPTFAATTALRTIVEDVAADQPLGAPFIATDPDTTPAFATLTHSLGSAADDAAFTIDRTTGQVRTQADLNHERQDSYQVTVQVSDNTDTTGQPDATIALTITVTDARGTVRLEPDPPRIGRVSAATVEDDPDAVAAQPPVSWRWDWSADRQVWSGREDATSARYVPEARDANGYLRVTAEYTDGHGTGKAVQAISAPVRSRSRAPVSSRGRSGGGGGGGGASATDPPRPGAGGVSGEPGGRVVPEWDWGCCRAGCVRPKRWSSPLAPCPCSSRRMAPSGWTRSLSVGTRTMGLGCCSTGTGWARGSMRWWPTWMG